MSDNQGGSIGNRKKQIISIAVLLALVALTVFAIKQSGQDLNFKMIASTFKHMNYGFLMLALLFMLLFIHIEGRALAVIAKALGYRLRQKQTFVYASADIEEKITTIYNCIFYYCCPVKLKKTKSSYSKPFIIGLREFIFKK